MSNNIRQAKPWDLLNKNIPKVSQEIQNNRLSICKECPEFIKATTQCKKCGCIMKLKTRLSNASCPIDKWGSIQTEEI